VKRVANGQVWVLCLDLYRQLICLMVVADQARIDNLFDDVTVRSE
jgi:hypothetical protein